MSEPIAFWNGAIVPYTDAVVSVHDFGFTMGATVSDFCRTFQHQLYRWEDHLERFRRSCEAVYITLPLTDKEISERALQVVEHNAALRGSNEELVLILVATPGVPPDVIGPVTFVMHTLLVPYARYGGFFQQGVSLATPPTTQVPPSCISPQIKHRSRLHYFIANEQARRLEPGALALLVDGEGNITETSIANFLLVRDGTVISPPASTILDGISLAVVRELCAELGIPFTERTLKISDCREEDEAMLTGTAFCLAGVRRINGLPLRWPGPVFEKLLAAWSARVGVDIRAQFA